ncbi:MAG: osmoprotectant transport system substrate-binding protein [Solirubrobacteraceae bacterium]|jgi:osmoprotectant transport system substrate-binding protein|nr:osmoprotectant transport system substrate-binding protein [Solirubrobacteraceae bacterium]
MRAITACLALLVALAVASCGGSDPPPRTTAKAGPVRIGTKNFTESEILGELYKQALEAKGFRVELQSSVGPGELTNRALRLGLLDMYPEYVGVLLSEVDKVVSRPTSPQAAYRLAKEIEERRGFTLLKPTRLSNENALAVKESFGRRRGVSSIPDLARLRPDERVGVAPEFTTRFEGSKGLRKLYRLSLRTKLVNVPGGRQYPELDSGRVAAASVFTTDSQLARGRYTLLRDPKGVFAKNHVAPVISQKALKAHGPLLAATLNAVSALLTTPVMRDLNAMAATRTPRQVADEFLRTHGLK